VDQDAGLRLVIGIRPLANDPQRLRSLTAWPWIISLNLNAHRIRKRL
jgi:hypothetical protein